MTPALPFRTVLAATDLSEASDGVLRAAGALARAAGARLHVIHAFDFPPSPYVDAAMEPATFQARIDEAEGALASQVARAVPPGAVVQEQRVEIYAAHRAIVSHARAIHADLIVIGPHVRKQLEVGFLGGTADRVLRTAGCPVLVTRGMPHLPLRHVAVPMDLSEWSRAALETACAWSAALGAEHGDEPMPAAALSVIHVVPRLLAGPDLPFARAEVLPGWNREMDAVAAYCGAGVEVREAVLWGDRPADEIVGFVEREGVDLVVMATHGYGAVKRALIGGTAQGVARRAPCPVLLVPPRAWKREDDAGVDAEEARAPVGAGA